MPCGASLVEQHSFARCERGVSFGCLGTSRSIWVQNCRGVFRCAGRRPPFRCGYPEGAPAYNCSCGNGRGDPFWTLSDEETQALARPREAEERRGDSPHRFALLLHGMLGTEVRSSSSDFHGKWHDGGHAGKRMLLRHCAASHLKYVVDAAARGEQVDVFAHSWNREAAPWFDEAYGVVLRGSQHEPPQYTSQALKARSQALSIGRAALLMREFAALRNVTYNLALAIRTDAVLSSPVNLHRMPADTVAPPRTRAGSPTNSTVITPVSRSPSRTGAASIGRVRLRLARPRERRARLISAKSQLFSTLVSAIIHRHTPAAAPRALHRRRLRWRPPSAW